jgi:hypothetical protein
MDMADRALATHRYVQNKAISRIFAITFRWLAANVKTSFAIDETGEPGRFGLRH